MSNCIFCQIATKEIPCTAVYEDNSLLAFRDLHPQSTTHILIIPKKHYATLNNLDDPLLASHLLMTAQKIAAELGLAENGYRTVINTNHWGGQTVFHLHLHLLGGRQLGGSMVG